MIVGVLALQGDFAAHGRALNQLGVTWQAVRTPEQLNSLDALVIPGGESTTLLKLMAPLNFFQAICHFHQQGRPLFGTCAGLILLAQEVIPNQPSLKLIDISVKRNAYGRQLESFISKGAYLPIHPPPAIEMVFIRAPQMTRLGQSVKVVAAYQQQPVAVQQDHVLVAAFHPEMSKDLTLYHYFINMVSQ